MPIAAVQLPPKTLRDAQQTLSFQCKCGCEFFRVDVEIYADSTWAPILSCISCGQICEPSEPLTNGPH